MAAPLITVTVIEELHRDRCQPNPHRFASHFVHLVPNSGFHAGLVIDGGISFDDIGRRDEILRVQDIEQLHRITDNRGRLVFDIDA